MIIHGRDNNFSSHNTGVSLVSPAEGALTIPSTLGGMRVTGINGSAFDECKKITSVTIPNSVEGIGPKAFRKCWGLTHMTIPDSVTQIGDQAFYDCEKLTQVMLGKNLNIIGFEAFAFCDGLTSINIPNSVTIIRDGCFRSCVNLTRVTIPSGVKYIASDLFCGCCKLTSVTLSSNARRIEARAFAGCTELKSITIPESVLNIEDSAFSSCRSLTSFRIPNAVTNIGNRVFENCSGLRLLELPRAWYGTDKLANASVPSGCVVIYRGVETLSVETGALAQGTVGQPYKATLAASGGVEPYYWSTAPDTIPVGLELTQDGVLQGIPEAEGYYDFSVVLRDKGRSVTKNLTLTVVEAPKVTTTTPVAVPYLWLEEQAAEILEEHGRNYEAAANATAANGQPVWKCYIAGMNTTNVSATFKMKSIIITNGEIKVEWEPDLNDNGTATERVYTVEGNSTPTNEWSSPGASSRFFRVQVEMP